jgi:hypothetical protein
MNNLSVLSSWDLYPPTFSFKPIQKIEQLVTQNLHLFASGEYVELTMPYIDPIPVKDVGMDRFIVCSTACEKYLGTVGVKESMVVCGQGRNKYNQTFLALAHTSSLKRTPQEVLFILSAELIGRGCLENSVEFYLIGGTLDGKTNSLDVQESFLQLANDNIYPIRGARFNLVKTENKNSLSVIFTENGVYFSTMDNFFPINKGEESQGTEFWPI